VPLAERTEAYAPAWLSFIAAYTTLDAGRPSFVATSGASGPTVPSIGMSGGSFASSTPAKRTSSASYSVTPTFWLLHSCAVNIVHCVAVMRPVRRAFT
jgi:hypothetical protein